MVMECGEVLLLKGMDETSLIIPVELSNIAQPSQSRSAFTLIDCRDSITMLPVLHWSIEDIKIHSIVSLPIVSLPNDEYHVLRPIPVVFEQTEDGWIAWFEQAGIGMSGTTKTEAKELLSHDILDAFILFTEEEDKLGPGPIAQLKVLRSYITWQK